MARATYFKLFELAIKKERQRKRDELYEDLLAVNNGKVPCYVCGRKVKKDVASLTYIIPANQGGDDSRGNLAISHQRCNDYMNNEEKYQCSEQ